MRGRIVVPVISTILTAGCGQAASTTPTSTATAAPPVRVDTRTMRPPSPPGPAPTLTRTTLTNSDDGATALTRPGQQITVTLTPQLGNWVRPHISDERVLRPVAVAGGYPSRQALRVTLATSARGQAQITTRTDLACLHSRPACLPPQRNWQVQVTVR